jgi:hypothetical protein
LAVLKLIEDGGINPGLALGIELDRLAGDKKEWGICSTIANHLAQVR